MLLKELLSNLSYSVVQGNVNVEIEEISYDSREIPKNSAFVCLNGASFDGHDYVKKALENGAVAIIAEKNVDCGDVPLVLVKNSREALAYISAALFSHPAKKLKTIGITGTKGKTTTACMIREILKKSNITAGIIGTLGVLIGDEVIKTNNTTPESYDVQKYLNLMVDDGCEVAIIEASSIGLKSHRLDGFMFDYGVFTNFSNDHIGGNEHANMEEYLQCKSLLFKKCKLGFVNIDDKNCENVLSGHTCKVKTYGFSKNADLYAENEHLLSQPGFVGIEFDLKGILNFSVSVAIPGMFSAYNALAAIAVANEFNVSKEDIKEAMKDIKVKGRIEVLPVPGEYTLLIDYAHNALSMENVLTTLRKYKPNRLITLFGAGGNRPKVRRYEMGEVSGHLSDVSVVTEDNSRNENVLDIISDIEVGLKKTNGEYIVIPNRYEAIKYCIKTALPGDIIVLAGKGHEDYQEKNGKVYHFDEREVVEEILKGEKV